MPQVPLACEDKQTNKRKVGQNVRKVTATSKKYLKKIVIHKINGAWIMGLCDVTKGTDNQIRGRCNKAFILAGS